MWTSLSKSQYIYWYCYFCIWKQNTWTACSLADLLKLSLLGPRGLSRKNPLCRRNTEDRISNHLPTFPRGQRGCITFIFLTRLNSVGPFSRFPSCAERHRAVPRSRPGVACRAAAPRCVFGKASRPTRKVERCLWDERQPSSWLTL